MKNHFNFRVVTFFLCALCSQSCIRSQYAPKNPIHVVRGAYYQPIPPYCSPVFGICQINRFEIPASGQPFELGGFDKTGNFVIELVNYDFAKDDWLKGDELLLEGDYKMPNDLAKELGGFPVEIKAGKYQLKVKGSKSKIVVFNPTSR